MTFATSDISPLIGTRVETDRATLTSGSRAREIRDLLERRGVLVFPKIDLCDDEQLAFARSLREVVPQGEKGIYKVTLDSRITPTAEYLKGTVLWHFDGWADDVPARGSILSARVLSAVGGQTEFANTYAAWEALPEDRKAVVEGLQVFHTMEGTQRYAAESASAEMRADWARFPAKRHPLVWTHQDGRKSMVIGTTADRIVGMEIPAGRAMLIRLQEWAAQPAFSLRHKWSKGDFVIWDNTGAMHRAIPYDKSTGRMMHRTSIAGTESIAA